MADSLPLLYLNIYYLPLDIVLLTLAVDKAHYTKDRYNKPRGFNIIRPVGYKLES